MCADIRARDAVLHVCGVPHCAREVIRVRGGFLMVHVMRFPTRVGFLMLFVHVMRCAGFNLVMRFPTREGFLMILQNA